MSCCMTATRHRMYHTPGLAHSGVVQGCGWLPTCSIVTPQLASGFRQCSSITGRDTRADSGYKQGRHSHRCWLLTHTALPRPTQQASLQQQPGSFTEQTCRALCTEKQLPLYTLYCGTKCACSASIPDVAAQADGCGAAAASATCGAAVELQYIYSSTARL
jgi:hypothetical protein